MKVPRKILNVLRLKRQTWVSALALAAGLALAGPSDAFILTGQITDSMGDPLPRIEIMIFDDDAFGDTFLGTAHTDSTGNYTAVLTGGWGLENPDIYLVVGWSFLMVPASFYNRHHMILQGTTPSGNSVTTAYIEDTSPVVSNHDASLDLTLNFQKSQTLPDVDQLRDHVNNSLNFYKDNKGTVTWVVNYDIPVIVRTATSGSELRVDSIFIASVDITGTGLGDIPDVYHEMAHLVHFRINGNTLPSDNQPSGTAHGPTSETDLGFAFKEGWASYVAGRTARIHGTGTKYVPYEDPNRTHWRGDEQTPTAYPGGVFESGEIVEGAQSGLWFDLDLISGFAPTFSAMVNRQPLYILQFVETYASEAGGPGSQGAETVHAVLQNHGIVYTRAKFESPALDPNDPPNTAPPEQSNVKELGGKTFVRGEVEAKFTEASDFDLDLAATIPMSQVRVALKPANISNSGDNGILGAVTFLTNPVAATAANVSIDTTMAGAGNGDGNWDVVILSINRDQFLDSLFPSWSGDGNTAVDTDEEYLKTLGTWFDGDGDPATLDDGYVVVDNTAPKVKDFKPN